MPTTVAEHCEVCPVLIEVGDAATVMDVMVNGALVTVICAEPETLVYPACVDVAMQDPVPTPEGVKTPLWLIVPPVAVQVTPVL